MPQLRLRTGIATSEVADKGSGVPRELLDGLEGVGRDSIDAKNPDAVRRVIACKRRRTSSEVIRIISASASLKRR